MAEHRHRSIMQLVPEDAAGRRTARVSERHVGAPLAYAHRAEREASAGRARAQMAIQPDAEPAGCFHEAAAADDRAITRYLPNGSTTAPGATTVNAATVSLVTLPKPRLPHPVGRVDRIILMLDLHSTSVIDPAQSST